jgi:tetraacyldisaccharide 4'-kinase
MKNKIQIVLLPLALIYQAVTSLRNYAFQKKWLTSYIPQVPTICVGNLSVGGTGKTPMIEYLIHELRDFKVAVVSRGYGRQTKGLLKVDPLGNPKDFGDECIQLAQKFDVPVWVSEKRVLGVRAAEAAQVDVILLDDAFQHRYVQAHLYFLLSRYSRPFFKDYVLPAGTLREARLGAKRADLLIFTKGPQQAIAAEQKEFRQQSQKYSNAPVVFSHFINGAIQNQRGENLKPNSRVGLVTAIANSDSIKAHLEQNQQLLKHWEFRDHHPYSIASLISIQAEAEKMQLNLVCTDKDRVKLQRLIDEHKLTIELFCLPVSHHFSMFDKKQLQKLILPLISHIKS